MALTTATTSIVVQDRVLLIYGQSTAKDEINVPITLSVFRDKI